MGFSSIATEAGEIDYVKREYEFSSNSITHNLPKPITFGNFIFCFLVNNLNLINFFKL